MIIQNISEVTRGDKHDNAIFRLFVSEFDFSHPILDELQDHFLSNDYCGFESNVQRQNVLH